MFNIFSALQALILQPIGDKGIAVIGGDTIRGFTNLDQVYCFFEYEILVCFLLILEIIVSPSNKLLYVAPIHYLQDKEHHALNNELARAYSSSSNLPCRHGLL